MKLFHVTWVLALAGAVTACNSGDPVLGCQKIDPATGQCCKIDLATGECEVPGTGGSDGGGGADGGGGSGGTPAFDCGDPAGGPLYDLSKSEFRPYNSLLTADPACAMPDLSGNPGADIADISTQCLILTRPDISGCMQFEETSPGNYNVSGEQVLSFALDITVAQVNARVIITTNSVTTFSGTATGSLPGTITMDDIGDGFNVNAAARGNVNCQATNIATGADVSALVCNLANFDPGDNPVPLPGDPGKRTFPALNTSADDFVMGEGPMDASGWYLVNPPDLAGAGTQWGALTGNRRN